VWERNCAYVLYRLIPACLKTVANKSTKGEGVPPFVNGYYLFYEESRLRSEDICRGESPSPWVWSAMAFSFLKKVISLAFFCESIYVPIWSRRVWFLGRGRVSFWDSDELG
jgi:hypothetical protein